MNPPTPAPTLPITHTSIIRQVDGCEGLQHAHDMRREATIAADLHWRVFRYNEQKRLAERRLPFHVAELRRIVSKSVGLSDSDITEFTKLAEGGSYRVFEATFKTGLKVITRLPYPSTIPRRFGVASEVATIEFLRLHGVPVPKVLDWSSSTSNSVGSEYIIMERALGEELEITWFTMSPKERMAVVRKIVDVEKTLFNIRFPACGSIFFKDSLDTCIRAVCMPKSDSFPNLDRFCIGPSTEYLWWHQSRHELGVNCGPWQSSEELLTAIGERELAWLRKFGEPRYPREYLYRKIYGHQKVDPQVQANYLLDYLKLVQHLVPTGEALNVPTIRHPDLSPSNIFVTDSGDITAVIDWQHATVLPIFLQAKIPKHFQNYGDDDSENFRTPKLPENFGTLSESDREREGELYRRRQVHYFYLGFTNHINLPHFRAMGKHSLVLRNQLYDIAGRPWEGDNTSLQAGLINTLALWSEIAPAENCSKPPIYFPPADVEECLARDTKQTIVDEQVSQIRDFIGVNIDGWVPNEGFEIAREKAKYLKKQGLDAAETEDERAEINHFWPFQDHEEID